MTGLHDSLATPAETALNERTAWQLRLLPLMIFTLVSLIVVFFVLSLIETARVREQIVTVPQLDLTDDLAVLNCPFPGATIREQQACVQWKVMVNLEAHTIARRYHQANVALVVRVWIKYLGFMTGMILALVGALFILARLTEVSSKLGAEGVFGKFTIDTVSPGVILVLLGTVLMITTLLVNPPTGVTDAPVYIRSPG